MWAVKFAVGDVVTGLLQFRDEDAAATGDGEDRIVGSMGNEDARFAGLAAAGRDEAGGVGEQGCEQVAIGDAESEGIGRTIGEAGEGNAIEMDGAESEGAGEGLIDVLDVGAVAVLDGVPGGVDRSGREEEKAEFIGKGTEAFDALLFGSAGSMEVDEERSGLIGFGGFRNVEESIARLAEAERVEAGWARRSGWLRTGLEAVGSVAGL